MHSKKIYIIAIIILALFISGSVLFRMFYYAPNDEIPIDPIVIKQAEEQKLITPKNEITESAYPIRLVIPKLDIDAKIQQVGITKKGNMAAPNNFVDVGWYKYGTLPGQTGSAIIAGHVDNGIALPAVFSRLEELKEGDDIYITMQDYELLHFSVTKSNIYDFDSKDNDVFTEDSGKLLKLITCTGAWLQKDKTHDSRLVVSAILVK